MGILISFSGVDGAGKSTQSALLAKYYRGKKKTVVFTEFAFGYFLLRPIIKHLRHATNSPKSGPVKRNKSSLAKLWFVLAFIDIWLGYFIYLLPLKRKHAVVIADRFYTDIWANLLYYGYLPTFAFGMARLLPKPDIAFVFRIQANKAQKQAGEFPLSYYHKQTKIYEGLSESIDCHVLDVNKPAAVVNKEILKNLQTFQKPRL